MWNLLDAISSNHNDGRGVGSCWRNSMSFSTNAVVILGLDSWMVGTVGGLMVVR